MLTGASLGPYRVLEKIGEGGMGEVYRATDTNLGRSVAIKVLPETVSADPDRLARFEREARTLATLNHPNIAQIYGLERGQGTTALVMEMVPGPTLADRIAQGRLPPEEALPIVQQIAEALEAAHEQGIVHRDLKPANIKVRDDGTVKVLDFGLAKAIEPAGLEAAGLSRSPTITTPAATFAGVILGTPAYMSPEQARGRLVDRRSDIWAFGVTLYEMLSGKRAFPDGESVSDTLAGILRGEPDWTALPAATPQAIRSLVERCLRKDVRRRLPDIGQARIEIEDARSAPVSVSPPAPATSPRRTFLWPAIAALSLLITAAIATRQMLTPLEQPETVVQFDIMGEPATILPTQPLSPDGRTVAFIAPFEGKPYIWTRPLDGLAAQPLRGTEDATRLSWSPDGEYVAFFSQGKLKKVALGGGPASVISNDAGREAVWGPDNTILIGGVQVGSGAKGRPILRVPASGGTPEPVTELASGETTHDYPEFLPDGRHFLYMARKGPQIEDWSLFAGSLDSKDRVHLPGIHAGVKYSASGHLLFERDRSLMAQPFDADTLTLTGDAVPLVLDRMYLGPHPAVSTSRNGTLAYSVLPSQPVSQAAWFDRSGRQLTTVGPPGDYAGVALSPDAQQIAFHRADDLSFDVYILNLASGGLRRVTRNDAADFEPVWSPDGRTLVFASSRVPAGGAGPRNISAGQLWTAGLASEEKLLVKTDAGTVPTDWSRDGRFITYVTRDDIWALPLPVSQDTTPVRVTNTPFIEANAVLSPDGRWIAYQSNESGVAQPDVYIQPFPTGDRRQVSTNGGSMPRWGHDGRELFYVGPDSTLLSVTVAASANGPETGAPVSLFVSRGLDNGRAYSVARDGRFLLNLVDTSAPAPVVTVVLNWTGALRKSNP